MISARTSRSHRSAATILSGVLVTVALAAVSPGAQADSSASPDAACTRTVTGSLAGAQTVAGGEKLCLRGATVGGAITVDPLGSLDSRNSTVNGAITLNGSKSFTFCGSATVGGAISASSGVAAVTIGNNGKCEGNDIDGAVTLASNTRNVSFAHNTTVGAVTVSSNAPSSGKAPVIADNTIGGALSCATNSPAPSNTGQPNTVAGGRTGQCAAPNF